MKNELRLQAIDRGWLHGKNKPLLPNYSFPLNDKVSKRINSLHKQGSSKIQSKVLNDMLNGKAIPVNNPCLIGRKKDIIVSEVDRYGFPIQLKLSLDTGLMRIDPYYEVEYIEEFYGKYYRELYLSPHGSIGSHLSAKVDQGEAIYKAVEKYLSHNAKIADIGCSLGGCLLPFKMRGYDTYGADFGEEFINYGKQLGLKLYQGSFPKLFNDGPFDLIILRHVLEHILDPKHFLLSLSSILSPKGVIYIEVPGVLKGNKGSFFINSIQNMHVWYFTQTTLTKVCEMAGFDKIYSDEKVVYIGKPSNRIGNINLTGEAQRIMDHLKLREKRSIKKEMKVIARRLLGHDYK